MAEEAGVVLSEQEARRREPGRVELVRDAVFYGGKKIREVRFGVLGSEEMSRVAEVECVNTDLYEMPERRAAAYGCLDLRLGAASKSETCATCKKRVDQCSGHFGVIRLELPVFHAGYFPHVVTLLHCVCKACSRALVSPGERETLLKRFRSKNSDHLKKATAYKKLVERCKGCTRCPHCHAWNGPVKKVAGGGALKAAHDKWRGLREKKKPAKNNKSTTTTGGKTSDAAVDDGEYAAFARAMNTRCSSSEDRGKLDPMHTVEYLSPLEVRSIFERIPDDDCELLWMDPRSARPEDLILGSLLVPPTPIRPSVTVDAPGGGSNEDDLTVKLQEIIEVNNALGNSLDKGGSVKMVVDAWNFLQVNAALYINGELGASLHGGRPEARQKPIRGLCQRLKGKAGRFRGNLSGKRVDFSARTVISPDPNLSIDQVGVPEYVAKIMTYPERVTHRNQHQLRALVRAGPDRHPGANYVELRGGGSTTPGGGGGKNNNTAVDPLQSGESQQPVLKKSLAYGNRKKIAHDLQVGDVVERHMRDGDVVLFNRQPSLHKLSIMAHKVKVMPWRTFRFNECVCAPYNADFDGDEMNMHLPQTEEARAEAALLMPSTSNVCTPRNGEPLIAATQDFVTAAYLLTQRDVFFHKETFCSLASYAGDAKERVDLPAPAVLKPRRLYTGKQLFSLVVKPNSRQGGSFFPHDNTKKSSTNVLCQAVPGFSAAFGDSSTRDAWPKLSFEVKERNYSGRGEGCCERDGYVIFRRSQLLTGNVAKKTVGDGSKTGLIYNLYRDHGPEAAGACMNRLAKLASRFLGLHRGFSIGIGDVTPSKAVLDVKRDVVHFGDKEAEARIRAFKLGTLPLKPGCDASQSLEAELTGILGKVRETCGKKAMDTLIRTNSPRIMAECGSKGSSINVSQMIACLGQQAVDGKRIAAGFSDDRTLPHFPSKALHPAAKGFVKNSFFSGLTATEFFFHTMGGREGLVDTAVKTAQTGYMARRLMKALEDLSVRYDGTVRNSENNVVQLVYGADGLDPNAMEASETPVDLERLARRIVSGDAANGTQQDDPAAVAALTGEEARSECRARLGELVDTIQESPAVKRSYVDEDTPAERFRVQVAEFAAEYADDRTRGEGRLTKRGVRDFAEAAVTKYARSHVEPGEAVGAVGAQCISEPGTQMTLKTFHFAGVASMNVTLGVPRLTEIINAAKKISTPIITAHLENPKNPAAARAVKARLEKTTLGEICASIHEVYDPDQAVSRAYLEVVLDLDAVAELHLDVDVESARKAILNAKDAGISKCPPILRALTPHLIMVQDGTAKSDTFRVILPSAARQSDATVVKKKHAAQSSSSTTTIGGRSKSAWRPGSYGGSSDGVDQPSSSHHGGRQSQKGPDPSRFRGDDPMLFAMHALKEALPNVVVAGVPSAERVVVNSVETPSQPEEYHLLVEGYGLEAVMGAEGVDGRNTTTNHVAEVENVLGIEAARSTIALEITYIMDAYGISIDKRHLALLSDVMTFKGLVLGITRFGVSKMRESVLMLASFERTTDHLFDAAVRGRKDAIVGVSECIIFGIPVPLGSGAFKLKKDDSASAKKPRTASKAATGGGGGAPSFFRRAKRTLIMNS